MTHTPGPWRWAPRHTVAVVTAANGMGVANVGYKTGNGLDANANACLIAAAPDMLAALRWYADQFCELGPFTEACGKLTDNDCSGCKARALITKIAGDAP